VEIQDSQDETLHVLHLHAMRVEMEQHCSIGDVEDLVGPNLMMNQACPDVRSAMLLDIGCVSDR
jgi:hypothetical protein